MTGLGHDPRSIVSQGEMDALLEGLQGLESSPSDLAQAWDWTALPRLARGPWPGLDAANDALAAHLQPSLCAWLGTGFRVAAEPLRVQSLADIIATDVGAFCALTLRVRAPTARGGAALEADGGELAVLLVQPHALQMLADLQFGGEGAPAADAPTGFAPVRPVPSAVAKQVLRRWGHQVLAALVQAWSDVAPLVWGVDQVAPVLPSCLRGEARARWLVCPFRMEFPGPGPGRVAGFELALPWTLMEPSARRWGGRLVGGRSSALARWPVRVRRLLDRVPLEASAHWSAGTLPLRTLKALKVGDWLPLAPQVEVKAGGVLSLRGRYVASGQQVAVAVEHKT